MSNLAITNSQGQPTLQSPDHPNNILKTLNSGIATQGLLSNTMNTASGMNRHYPDPKQQHALNGTSIQQNNAGSLQPANQMLDMNNVVTMPTMHQNSGQSNTQQGQNAWLQHMILNPIGPLGGNDTGVIQNQANGVSQQSPGNFQGNSGTSVFQQQAQQFSNQVGGTRGRSQSISSPFFKHQMTQPTMPSQPQQQQQSMPMNLQLSAAMQMTPLQQQQHQTSNTSQLPSISNTMTSQSNVQQQQQQQQQLLLLALMLQQQNNNMNNANGIDNNALSNVLASTEGLKLINSLLTGQQLPQVQGNQVQQQQQQQQQHQSNQIFQGQSTIAAQQQDMLSNQLSQPMQLQSLSMLNQSSPMPNGSIAFPAASNAISNLKMPTDSKSLLDASKMSKGRVINLPMKSVKTDDAKSTKAPTVNSRFPRLLYCDSDDAILGEYQTLLRQQLELFEADSHDVINGTFRQGRTTPIRLGQIGLRCKHCAKAPLSARTKGSVYCKSKSMCLPLFCSLQYLLDHMSW